MEATLGEPLVMMNRRQKSGYLDKYALNDGFHLLILLMPRTSYRARNNHTSATVLRVPFLHKVFEM